MTKKASKNDKITDQAETGQRPPQGGADDVIDAEIVGETINPQHQSDQAQSDQAQHTRAQKKAGFRFSAGWATSLGLSFFIAGLMAAPYAAPGLERLGLLPAKSSVGRTENPSQAPLTLPIESLNSEQYEQLTADIIDLRTRLADQRRDMAALIARQTAAERAIPASLPPSSGADPALRADIDQLRKDIDALGRSLQSIASTNEGAADTINLASSVDILRTELSALTDRVASTEATARGLEAGALSATPRGRLFLRLSALEREMKAGKPFGAYLDDLRPDLAVLPAIDQARFAPSLTALEGLEGGVWPLTLVQSEFNRLLPDVLKAASREEGSVFADLFTIRRTDRAARGRDAVLLRVEKAVTAGDIATALDQIKGGFDEAALQPLGLWLTRAEAYRDAWQAYADFRRLMLDDPAFQDRGLTADRVGATP